jgi:hypothetical protein
MESPLQDVASYQYIISHYEEMRHVSVTGQVKPPEPVLAHRPYLRR